MNPSLQYIRDTLVFVTDVSMFYGQKVQNYVKTKFTQNLIFILKQHDSDQQNKDILDYAYGVSRTISFPLY